MVKRQQELDLAPSNRLFSFLENDSDAIMCIDENLKVFFTNKRFKKLCAANYQNCPQENDHIEKWLNDFGEKVPLIKWNELLNKEDGYIVKDQNSNSLLHVKVSLINDEKEKLEGFLIRVTRVPTKEFESLDADYIEQKYKFLIQVTSPIVWVADHDGAFVASQPAWQLYTGQKKEDYEGFGWVHAFHNEDQEKLLQDWTDAVQLESDFSSSGRIWCEATKMYHFFDIYAIPIRNKQNRILEWFGSVIDKQELKKQQTIQESTLMQLEETVQELESFAYIASHDLQEPLRMITSYLQLIENRYHYLLDSKGRSFVNYTIESANRMRTLIEDLLIYSRISYKRDLFTWVDLNKTVENILEHLQHLIWEKNAIIECDKLPVVRGIPLQMHQLFQNLISNAIKFCPDHKRLHVKIGCSLKNSSWQFSVSDNGIGIPEEYLSKIFEVFQRLNSRDKYDGNGIGLSICKKIVKNHKGKIWVTSMQGEGTTFYFTVENQLK